ncbi:radical SAM family heme chaperone HemW [Litorivivens sp.]|uniref:radical SAM family heme chaperone HemW n=2 Tax=Litorivivens sp. TaxID=2020868 RepID=UPI0035665F4F
MTLPPLALYLHIPWCIRKCPYCDFNSHEQKQALPEASYIDALLEDLNHDLEFVQDRPIHSVFIGGGTPSLFSAQAYDTLFRALRTKLSFSDDCEITLEANPGTFEQEKFEGYRAAGINRLSLGVQSFQDVQLEKLGRIHSSNEAQHAIASAQAVGFDRINVDLMHGLPEQTTRDALDDISRALDSGVSHLSWYQLTIEPNTHFYNAPPTLPVEDTLADIQQAGQRLIADRGLQQYEVSAYAAPGEESRHNLNYWQFGDYLALGAGAHGKVTRNGSITRYQKTRLPDHYLQRAGSRTAQSQDIAAADLPFEFAMNALRLNHGFALSLFSLRTGLDPTSIMPIIDRLCALELLECRNEQVHCTALGQRYLNDVVAHFLP